MGRSGYDEHYGEDYPGQMELYRNTVERAIKGKRGQKFLRELLAALDAMPVKKLITEDLERGTGEVCALGAVMRARGIPDLLELDPEDHELIGKRLDIAPCLVAEVEFLNDEDFAWKQLRTDEERWQFMRDWAAKQLVGADGK